MKYTSLLDGSATSTVAATAAAEGELQSCTQTFCGMHAGDCGMSTQPPAAPPTAIAAEGLVAPAAGRSDEARGVDAVVSGIPASKFVDAHGNTGPRSSLIPLPTEKSEEDSDADASGGDASIMDHEVVSKGNRNMMTNRKLEIQRPTGPGGDM